MLAADLAHLRRDQALSPTVRAPDVMVIIRAGDPRRDPELVVRVHSDERQNAPPGNSAGTDFKKRMSSATMNLKLGISVFLHGQNGKYTKPTARRMYPSSTTMPARPRKWSGGVKAVTKRGGGNRLRRISTAPPHALLE